MRMCVSTNVCMYKCVCVCVCVVCVRVCSVAVDEAISILSPASSSLSLLLPRSRLRCGAVMW